MDRFFVIFGAVFGFLAVATGAFGAHALKAHFASFPNLEATFETAVRYHFYHAIALLFVGWAITQWPGSLTNWAGYCFIAGILIFSGSLYTLVLTNMRWLGAITPIGGVAFLSGWVCLALAAWRYG